MDVLCIWMCYVNGWVTYTDVICMCYVYGSGRGPPTLCSKQLKCPAHLPTGCYVNGCVMYTDVICMCYVYGSVMYMLTVYGYVGGERREEDGTGGGGGGRDAFKTRTHTSESGGKKETPSDDADAILFIELVHSNFLTLVEKATQ